MNDSARIDHSRPMRVADLASGGKAPDLSRRCVLVTCDSEFARSAAMRVLVTNLRRLPISLYVDVADEQAGRDLVRACAEIDPDRPIRLARSQTAPHVHVHIGRARPDADVSGVPVGHGVRLRRRGRAIPDDDRPASGLGHVFTGATLTGEVFKDLLDLDAGRARRLDELDFCPVALSGDFTAVAGAPELTDITLVGCGAIGTAIALILREQGAAGSLTVVDPQVFASENLGTYSIGTVDDAVAERDKVNLIEAALPGVTVTPVKGTAIEYLESLERTGGPWPRLVLGALDSIEARHEVARLHTDLVLDGSTGGGAGTTLSLREARFTGPCLRCLFPGTAGTQESALVRLSKAVGLSLERLVRGDDPLTEKDLADLTADQRDKLRPHLGKPVCGLARDLGFGDDFAPSVVFVAQQAAALVVGALVRRQSEPRLPTRDVEYDALFGPVDGMYDDRLPQPDCRCQRDAEMIGTLRRERGQ